MKKKHSIRECFSYLIEMDIDRFDPSNHIDEGDNSRDYSASRYVESIEYTHNQNWKKLKPCENDLVILS